MTLKAAYIQQPTPAQRGSRVGNDATDLPSLCFHPSQHGLDGGRNRNAEGFTSSAFGAGECKHAVFQVHALKRDLRLSQTAARGQGDFKADFHPFGHTFHGQSLPGDFNLIIRKHGFNSANRAPFNSVIQKGDGIHLSEQSALPMNPFKNLQILARLVASSLTAGRAGKALAPLQINFTIICRKRLQGYFFFDNKSHKMTPAIPIVNFCQSRNGVILDQILNPIVTVIRSLFVHSNSSCVSRCLCAMQRVVDSVAGALAAPFSSRVFKTNKEPRTTLFNVGISQGDNGNIR